MLDEKENSQEFREQCKVIKVVISEGADSIPEGFTLIRSDGLPYWDQGYEAAERGETPTDEQRKNKLFMRGYNTYLIKADQFQLVGREARYKSERRSRRSPISGGERGG